MRRPSRTRRCCSAATRRRCPKGRVTQFGPTIEVFRKPNDLVTAETFADPPLNTIVLRKSGSSFLLEGGVEPAGAGANSPASPMATTRSASSRIICHLTQPSAARGAGAGPRSLITEITGSESFVHLDFADARWVMLAHGIRDFEPDETIEVFIDPRHIMVFDRAGRAVAGRRKLAA